MKMERHTRVHVIDDWHEVWVHATWDVELVGEPIEINVKLQCTCGEVLEQRQIDVTVEAAESAAERSSIYIERHIHEVQAVQ